MRPTAQHAIRKIGSVLLTCKSSEECCQYLWSNEEELKQIYPSWGKKQVAPGAVEEYPLMSVNAVRVLRPQFKHDLKGYQWILNQKVGMAVKFNCYDTRAEVSHPEVLLEPYSFWYFLCFRPMYLVILRNYPMPFSSLTTTRGFCFDRETAIMAVAYGTSMSCLQYSTLGHRDRLTAWTEPSEQDAESSQPSQVQIRYGEVSLMDRGMTLTDGRKVTSFEVSGQTARACAYVNNKRGVTLHLSLQPAKRASTSRTYSSVT